MRSQNRIRTEAGTDKMEARELLSASMQSWGTMDAAPTTQSSAVQATSDVTINNVNSLQGRGFGNGRGFGRAGFEMRLNGITGSAGPGPLAFRQMIDGRPIAPVLPDDLV